MWEKVRKLIKKGGGRFIIIENDQPAYVVLPVDEYETLLEGEQTEKANQELTELKAQESQQPQVEEMINKEEDEVKVEDLPF